MQDNAQPNTLSLDLPQLIENLKEWQGNLAYDISQDWTEHKEQMTLHLSILTQAIGNLDLLCTIIDGTQTASSSIPLK